MFYRSGHEVAVCYFRMGYTPKDFQGEDDWKSRLLLERSKAIKCPNVYYHLAGTKKVQQVGTSVPTLYFPYSQNEQ